MLRRAGAGLRRLAPSFRDQYKQQPMEGEQDGRCAFAWSMFSRHTERTNSVL